MGNIVQSKFHENEIAKSEDFGFVTESDVNNLESMLHKLIGEPTNHCILRGGTVSQRSTPSMNVDIAAILAISADGELIYADSVTGPVSVEDGEASDRIDTLEIRRVDTDYDAKQRAFKDPDTGTVTYSNVDTKVRTEIEAQVVKGTAGSGNAPASTVGWMKLAEIHVSAGETTSILNAHIENVTADLDGGTNSEWTTETGSAWKIGDIVYLKDMFREKHLEDGDHKNDVIRDNHIDWGTGSGQVSAADVPIADGGNRYTGTNVETAMQEVAGAGRTTETVKGNADDLTSHEGTTAAGVHGSASAATANRLVHRDAAGRAKVAAPSASDDIARKNEVDTVQTNLNSHINDTSAAHAASAISAMDEFAHSSSSNVQDVLDDLDQAITNHQNDTVDAHDASAISTVDEFANSNATNVQDVLDDLDAAIEALEGRDITLTLAGDLSGSTTFTNLGNATLTANVLDSEKLDGAERSIDEELGTSDVLIPTQNAVYTFVHTVTSLKFATLGIMCVNIPSGSNQSFAHNRIAGAIDRTEGTYRAIGYYDGATIHSVEYNDPLFGQEEVMIYRPDGTLIYTFEDGDSGSVLPFDLWIFLPKDVRDGLNAASFPGQWQ
jgi:hypothetical protein